MNITEDVIIEEVKRFPFIVRECIYEYVDPYKSKFLEFWRNNDIRYIINLRNSIIDNISIIIEGLIEYWVPGDELLNIELPLSLVEEENIYFKLVLDEVYIRLSILPIYMRTTYRDKGSGCIKCYTSCCLLKCRPESYIKYENYGVEYIPVYKHSLDSPMVYIDMIKSVDICELLYCRDELICEFKNYIS